MSENLQEVRRLLAQLKQRLVSGEIDEATFDRLRDRIVGDLEPGDRSALGLTPTPQPATPTASSAYMGTPTPVGPSGGAGAGARTMLPRRARIEFEPGEVLFDQWRLERELGRGGFGVVFEATDQHLEQRQAVKVLDPKMVENADLLARFRREVLLMRRLVHRRIVRVFDYRESPQESLALLSMELVEGCSLRELKERAKSGGRRLPVAQVLSLLWQIMEALDAAHEQGVIHRDVSPGNVLLGGGRVEELLADSVRDPRAKLVDFGIAGLLERTELSAKSRALGTAAYVAPEVFDDSAEISPAIDVYGAGAVAYELLTGMLPLGRFAEPASVRPDISNEVNGMLLGLLEFAPRKRPLASEVVKELAHRVERLRQGDTDRPGADRRAGASSASGRSSDDVERSAPSGQEDQEREGEATRGSAGDPRTDCRTCSGTGKVAIEAGGFTMMRLCPHPDCDAAQRLREASPSSESLFQSVSVDLSRFPHIDALGGWQATQGGHQDPGGARGENAGWVSRIREEAPSSPRDGTDGGETVKASDPTLVEPAGGGWDTNVGHISQRLDPAHGESDLGGEESANLTEWSLLRRALHWQFGIPLDRRPTVASPEISP